MPIPPSIQVLAPPTILAQTPASQPLIIEAAPTSSLPDQSSSSQSLVTTAPAQLPLPPLPPILPLPPSVLPLPPVLLPHVLPIQPVIMAAPGGPAAMPPTRSHHAPFFSGHVGDPLDDFLREFEELAISCTLMDQQKIETVICYILNDLRDLWKILEGYATHDWALFRQLLEQTYETTSAQSRYSKQKLHDFIHYNSWMCMCNEEDIMRYYRQFLVFCQPLIESRRITTDERDGAFWYGFHPDDREKLSPRLIAKFLDQVVGQPYGLQDAYKIARAVFATSPFIPIEI